MTPNEVITICISTGALAVSLVTLYLTFFYKRTGLVGTLLIRYFSDPGKDGYEYALSNVGNTQLLLREVKLLTGRGENASVYDMPDSHCPEIPLVIEPGQVRVIRVQFVGNEIEKAKKHRELCFVSFTLISSRGKVYEVMHDITAIDEQKGERLVWKPFKLGKAKIF